MSLLIENGTVLTGGKTPAVLPNHSVLIENGYITEGRSQEAGSSDFRGKRIDASGKVVAARLHQCPHPFLQHLRARPDQDQAGRELRGRAEESLVAARLGLDHRGLLLQRADRLARFDPPRHDDAHRPSRQPQRGSRLAAAPSRRRSDKPACAPASATNSPTATARASAKEGLEENVSFIRHCQAR